MMSKLALSPSNQHSQPLVPVEISVVTVLTRSDEQVKRASKTTRIECEQVNATRETSTSY